MMENINEVEKFYYSGTAFYSSLFINTAYANGLAKSDLIEISAEDYHQWFNPPEGKYGGWVDGKPVLLEFPPMDYVLLANQKLRSLREDITPAISILQTKLAMGRKLTEAETKKMNAWLDYSDALDAVEINEETAKDIVWPEKPGS